MLIEDPGIVILRAIRSVAVSLSETYSAQDNPLLQRHLDWIDEKLPLTNLTVEEELRASFELFRLSDPHGAR